MKLSLRSAWLCALLSFLLLAGCRIDIRVPNGGSVYTQSGALVCEAGATCSVEILDLDFDETFVAVGQSHTYFEGWKKDKGYLCGNKTEPCRIFTEWLNLFPDAENLLAADETVLVLEPQFSELGPAGAPSILTNAHVPDEDIADYETHEFEATSCNLEVESNFLYSTNGLPNLVLRDDVGGTPSAVVSTLWDKNGDGHDDLLLAATYFSERGSITDIPAKGLLVYLETSNAGLRDRTEEVFGSRKIDYLARKIRTGDINGDGAQDLLLVTNNEDARSTADTNNIATPVTLLSSQPDGSFARSEIGYAAFNHDGGMADIDNDGIVEIIQAAYRTHSRYGQEENWWWSPTHIVDLEENRWIDRNADMRDRNIFSANAFRLADFNADGCLDLFANTPLPAIGGASIYSGNCDGTYTKQQYFPAGQEFFAVPGLTWTDDETVFAVTEIGGEWISGMALFWSAVVDVDRDGDLDILYALNGFKISEDDRNNGYVDQDNGTPHVVAYLLKNVNGSFRRYAYPLGPVNDEIVFLHAQVTDINGDLYPDLVIADWQVAMSRSIFVNDGRGRFHQVPLDNQSAITERTMPIPIDHNSDGIMDFIAPATWELFESRDPLPTCGAN